MIIESERVASLNERALPRVGDIYYWMTREQRLDDNWSLLYALDWAKRLKRRAGVVFFLPSPREGFAEKAYAFMAAGLLKLMEDAEERGISLALIQGRDPVDFWKDQVLRGSLAGLVCDFHPLRSYRKERERAGQILGIPVVEVDGHNVVPCRHISPRQEYSAYTLRRKIEPALTRFLREIPPLPDHPVKAASLELSGGLGSAVVDRSRLVNLSKPAGYDLPRAGYVNGMGRLGEFLDRGWENYNRDRNNPVLRGQSELSPYLHSGQISPQTVAFEAARLGGVTSLKGGFLDEVIVRRELSDNYCWYNRHYDSCEGFPSWARETLERHGGDERLYLYGRDELEGGVTHDELWNAAQSQLVNTGKMHGYMRMYWAKKILEWSPSACEAMERAVYLNDKYSLDGEDPNGYAGCAWSIGGLHDRAWGERAVFGKIRYMSRSGCRRKFKVDEYVREYGKNDGKNKDRNQQLPFRE